MGNPGIVHKIKRTHTLKEWTVLGHLGTTPAQCDSYYLLGGYRIKGQGTSVKPP